jgi:transposase
MFLHVNRSGGREYLRILETYYDDEGRHKQRVVANLGRLDKVAGKLDQLAAAIARYADKRLVAAADVRSLAALPWGPVLLARHLWEALGLGSIIRSRCRSHRRGFDVAEAAFVLVANRLIHPGSEHALARWLENTWVPDAAGNRWLPQWLAAEQVTKNQRVKVEADQLQRWYRTLDALLAGKQAIEHDLFRRVCDLFSQKVDMVFYDVTSVYFERRRPKGMRRHGYSRDGRPRNVQVVLGVVMANGWPIAHHVFPGNTADKATLQDAIADVDARFGLRRVLVVGDRGMVDDDAIRSLTEDGRQMRYLLGVHGRRCDEAARVLAKLDDNAWRTVDAANRVQQIVLDDPGVRYLVVASDERQVCEQQLRERDMAATAADLQKLKDAVSAGKLKQPDRIAARAQNAISRHHGHRCFSWEVRPDGTFDFWPDDAKLKAEQLREGKYILKTDDPGIDAVETVGIYKQLSDVEWAYRDLKDVIRMRPVYHKTDDRAMAHLFVATLALFLKRTLEHKLAEAGLPDSPTAAFEAMASIGVSVLDIAGEQRLLTAGGGPDARRILAALGIRDTDPPQPKKATEMSHR